MSFNQKEYIKKYKKEHYCKLSVDLTKEEKQELLDVCSKKNMSIKRFIINAIKEAKK